MLKHISSILQVIATVVLLITFTVSCCRGAKREMRFTGTDGTSVTQHYRLSPNNLWKSKIPTNGMGTVELFTTAGQLVGQYAVSNGVLHGRAMAWYADDGTLVMDATYSNGELHGTYTRWHSKNLKEVEGVYSNGLPVGRHLAWYENGQIKSDENYVDGLEHGHSRTWLPDGSILADITYSNMWHQNGTAVLEWVEGKPPIIGIFTNGVLIEKRIYRRP